MRREEEIGRGRDRVQIGTLFVDRLTFTDALEAICDLVRGGRGGAVFTPNVDHVVTAEDDVAFRQTYSRASLSLADGMPVVWAARLLGRPVPEKISGSDFIEPLLARAAASGFRVYLLGSTAEVAGKAAGVLRARGVEVCGTDSPIVGDPHSAADRQPIVARLRSARPDLVLVAFGAPKQEFFIDGARADVPGAVFVGIGASLDFLAGAVRRAPRWMSRSGLEWLYRLAQEPRRLWRRYLVRDPRFARIVARNFVEQRLTGRRPALPLPRAAARA
jgi:N-acetylglucosaminyldiphosphoundecaprenol N-acetyl-beta-D-mannosaminyltransferase